MYSVTCYYIDILWLEIVCSFYSHIEGISKIVAFPDIINHFLLRCKLRLSSSLIMVCQGITGNAVHINVTKYTLFIENCENKVFLYFVMLQYYIGATLA